MTKPKVAFICVHNSCRSQIAEALGKALASDLFESYSAGTETKPQINQDAVRLMKELYGIDMEQTQYSKLILDIPEPDIAISMGCNVGCPFIGRPFDDNWGLDDPTGKSDEEFKKPVYDAYMKARDKTAFRTKHEAELVIFEAAKSTLLAVQGDKKLPSLNSLQAEQQRLLEDQQRLYDERAKLKKEARVIDTMKANVDDFLSPTAAQDRDKKQSSELE